MRPRTTANLRIPPGLRAVRVHLGSEEFVLLSFDLCGDIGQKARNDALSPSQRNVAELAAEGRLNAEIARAQSTSFRTVENQIAVYRKSACVPVVVSPHWASRALVP